MTQRTRQAIMDYWISKHAFYWRRYSRFFLLILPSFIIFSPTVFAEETRLEAKPASLLSLVSKESKPVKPTAGVPVKKNTLKKIVAEETTSRTMSKKSKFELPAPDPEDLKAEGIVKFQRGIISARNKSGMAVEYDMNETEGSSKEIWVNFHKKLKLAGMKDLSSLGEGDTVEVEYKITKQTKKILLQGISLISKKPKEEPQPSVAEESQARAVKP